MIPAKFASVVHGEYLSASRMSAGSSVDEDAYVACLKDLRDGHTELQIIPKPETVVYVAKPQFRQNTVKREQADKSELDMYRTRVNQIPTTLWNGINNPGRWRTPPGFIRPKKILDNPYVYGADIDYGVTLRMAYNKVNGGAVPETFNVGALDIETDVHGSEQVILCTFMNGDGRTYVGILKSFFLDHTPEEVIKMWKEKVEPDFKSKLTKKCLDLYEKSGGITIFPQTFSREIDLIKWIFDRIHECKPDFVGVWNMDYDIPWLIKRIEFRQSTPEAIMCHPDVPYKYRVANYKADPGKKDGHMTDRWSWFHLTDYTRYYDAMCLYGRLRKAKPREPSYRLDAIGGKEIGAGKLEFGSGESHSTMQRFHQVEYTVYNIVDVLIMHVMELKNQDVKTMNNLIGVSTLDCFAHQSIQLKNYFYEHLDGKGAVPASIGNRIDDKWDYLISNKGGAVLSPDLALYISVPALKESNARIRASRFVCDLDVASTILAPCCRKAA